MPMQVCQHHFGGTVHGVAQTHTERIYPVLKSENRIEKEGSIRTSSIMLKNRDRIAIGIACEKREGDDQTAPRLCLCLCLCLP